MKPMGESAKKIRYLVLGCLLGAAIGLAIGSGYMVFFSFVAGVAGLITMSVRGEI